MPLDDSDIFKAELYKRCPTQQDKDDFTKDWKNLYATLNDVDLTLNDLFRFYSYYIRASKDITSKEIALRKFYSKDKYKLFSEYPIMEDLQQLALFWSRLLSFDDSLCNLKTKHLLQCLQCYPNEYWKYITTVFFFKHQIDQDFKDHAEAFFSNLLALLLVKYIEKPTVNAIKDDIFGGCIEVYKSGANRYAYPLVDFENRLQLSANWKITKSFLLLHAYLVDPEQPLIDQTFQIEHIFPQKWDKTYFTWSEEEADLYLNKYGNKVVMEKRLNIQASNGFYSKKKNEYAKSAIKDVQDLCQYSDWTQETIRQREEKVFSRLKEFFKQNLEPVSTERIKLLQYSGGNSKAEIYRLVDGNSVSFELQLNDTTRVFPALEEALSCIDAGMLKYGSQDYLVDSPELRSFLDAIVS